MDYESGSFQAELAARAAWNTQWILVIPGGQFDDSSQEAKLNALRRLIYGSTMDPTENQGITDIRWIIQAYKN